MLNESTPYLGSLIKLDEDHNIVVSTYIPFRNLSIFVQAFYDPLIQSECSFIKPVQISLHYEVCGTETITV